MHVAVGHLVRGNCDVILILNIYISRFVHLLGFCLDGQQSVHTRPSLTQLHLTHRPLLMHEEQVSIFWLVLVVCVK